MVYLRGGFLGVGSESGKLWTSQKFLAIPGPARLVTQYTGRKARRLSEKDCCLVARECLVAE